MKRLFLFLLCLSAWGACTTDSRGVVITGLTAIQDNLIGPITCAGTSPWIFGDLLEKGIIDYQAPIAIAETPVLGAALSGTFSWSPGNVLTTTVDQTAALSGVSYIALAWNSVDGAGTGRAICPISGVTSTTVTCSANLYTPASSGVTGYKMSLATGTSGYNFTAWIPQNGPNVSTTWNYYDVGIGLTRYYYRNTASIYQTYARAFADIQWQWVLDHGYNFNIAPRAASMVSQFFRALDGHPERFPGLYQYVQDMISLFGSATNCPACDNREGGYTMWDIALGAKTDPDATRHAQYCSWLTTYIPAWNSKQAADGSWPEDEFSINASFPMAPKSYSGTPLFGGAAWREAINVKAWEAAYESLNDTTAQGCNQPTIAAATLTALTNAVTWQQLYARDTVNRGTFYEVNTASNDQVGNGLYPGPGSVSATRSSATITGSGTNWVTAGYNDGTHFIGIIVPGSAHGVYKIASCASNTSCTLTVNYGYFGETVDPVSVAWVPAPSASSSCGGSLASFCFFGAGNGDRNLNRTMCGGMGWLYAQTLNTTYLGWADECVSESLGGPTAGPTSADNMTFSTLPCSGPACDGYVADTANPLPNCVANGGAAPCTNGNTPFQQLLKPFGEAFGALGIDNELAWRLAAATGAPSSTVSGKAVGGVTFP